MDSNRNVVRPNAALIVGLVSVLCTPWSSWAAEAHRGPADEARAILEETGVQGGLIAHVGCGDGKLTAALGAGDGYLVHGLDDDADDVRRARARIRSLGRYGPVSVDRLAGHRLPYVENLVNLLVSDDLCGVPMDEVMRVLAPNGVAYVKTGGAWTKTVKPRPDRIDEWTHFLHDASNNAVSTDTVVGPPERLQWVGGPTWGRSHDHLAGVSGAVSAGGRIFYIVDEAAIAAVILQPRWALVARDAFSGVVLWKRTIGSWQYHLRGFRTGPSDLARRLVAIGDRVYVTLSIDGPLTALDAATGRTLRTYDGTAGTREVVHHAGTLFVVAGDATAEEQAAKARRRGEQAGLAEVRSQRPPPTEILAAKRVLAIDAATGSILWTKANEDTAELMPTTLAVSGDRVFFQSADEILCFEAGTGHDIWRADRPLSRIRPGWSAPTLVVYRDVVLSADRAVADKKNRDGDDAKNVEWIVSSGGGQAPVGELIAFSARDGTRLWSSKCREGYNSPVDVLVADGLVWTGDLVSAKDPGITQGLDPKTGRVARTRPKDKAFFAPGMVHHRCYRNKATERYLVLGRSGVEFVELATGKAIANHWTRGTCQYGVMPSNGLLYAPPHACACFVASKLSGFNCLAPASASSPPPSGEDRRREEEPSFGAIRPPPADAPVADPEDWPTYRHDAARSGRTNAAVPADLQPSWQADLGGKLSPVVVADGKLFVAQVDAHTVCALDADNGKPAWSYTAGGRIDSPPTIWQGRALFGSADGWVYCLRSSDGTLVWRFRAAPTSERIMSCGQIESAWPVPGSVLVRGGVVYCVAGRSSYLRGGIRLCRLDAKTGRKLSETIIDHRDPETSSQRKGSVRGTTMPGALPDVLSSDGTSVYMRHTRFGLTGEPLEPHVAHLFSPAGFLDGSWWHRTYWLVGTKMGTNYGGWPQVGNRVPAGRLLVLDESRVYGFGRNHYNHHGAHIGIDGATVFHYIPQRDAARRLTHHQAFAIDRPAPGEGGPATGAGAKARRNPATVPKQNLWTRELPILARAMVLARDTLFLAGPPEFLSNDDPAGAIEGTQGASLIAVSPSDGKNLADEHPLESPPVWDGMAVAGGRLYLATVDGKVLCFRGKE